MDKIRTRFAPSPTGYMHIGNLRTALYAYLITKHSNGDFILRVEDTDQKRYVDDALNIIYQTLEQVGLKYDEGPDKDGGYGPYVQSQRLELYQKYAKELVNLGGAHYCFCKHDETESEYNHEDPCKKLSKEEIEEKLNNGESYVIRQTINKDGTVTFNDEIYGSIETEKKLLDEGVLLKSDGFPTYNLANVIDDHFMDITHVIRGNEYLSSTPKYNLIYESFGWDIPKYIHLPAVMKDEHNKLSKRNGDASFNDLVTKGYLPEAILNYIVLLGWSSPTEQEIYSLEELIKVFSIDRISKSPSIFDIDKLKWMNGMYIRNMEPEEFCTIASPYYNEFIKTNIDILELSKVLQNRTEVLGDIPEMIDFIEVLPEYSTELFVNKRMKSTKEKSLISLNKIYEILNQTDFTNFDNLHNTLLEIPQILEMKNGEVLWPLRTALSGKEKTPGGGVELAFLLGKEECLKRINKAIEMLKEELN
ncbi:MAG: glutamate--tRNA ligase [Bacilli bacterium]|nr:glutamate--tRNA ligase [Bacilli bacterium]